MGTEVFDRIRKGKTPINVPLTSIVQRIFRARVAEQRLSSQKCLCNFQERHIINFQKQIC